MTPTMTAILFLALAGTPVHADDVAAAAAAAIPAAVALPASPAHGREDMTCPKPFILDSVLGCGADGGAGGAGGGDLVAISEALLVVGMLAYFLHRTQRAATSGSLATAASGLAVSSRTSKAAPGPRLSNETKRLVRRPLKQAHPQLAAATSSTATPAAMPGSSAAAALAWDRRESGAGATSAAVAIATAPVGPEADALAEAVRGGHVVDLPWLLEDAIERCCPATAGSSSEPLAARLLLSSLRACATWKCFPEALEAFDRVGHKVGAGNAGVWSILLYSATEAREFHRCEAFFQRLCAVAAPSCNDFLNMSRYFAHQRDRGGFRRMLHVLEERGCQFDAVTRNRAIGACCTTGAVDLAEELFQFKGLCSEGLDVVAFNTLIKGCALAGRHARCFELYGLMQQAGIAPSEKSFGILLETCSSSREFTRAQRVFADLAASGLPMNVVHYTTYMKCLVNAGNIDAATALLGQMRSSARTTPDLVTYSMLIKAHSDNGCVTDALGVLDQMMKQGIMPDAVVLNIILSGCCARPVAPKQVIHVLRKLMSHGLEPSTVTLSIVVKAFAKTESFGEALQLLEESQQRFGAASPPEPRLFAQLAQASVRAGQGRVAVEAYATMVKVALSGRRRGGACPVGEASSARMLQICSSAGFAMAAQCLHDAVLVANRSRGSASLDELQAAAATAINNVRR